MANRKNSHDLEPIDVYGNWRVKTLVSPHDLEVGLTPGESTFKIKNDENTHVLEKKSNVSWNGTSKEIPLEPVGRETPEYKAGFRLKASVESSNRGFDVFLGSENSGKSLIFYIDEDTGNVGQTRAGSFGTAGRGG